MPDPTLNRAQRRKLKTRQKLIETTARILAEESYEALTIKAITEGADVGYGTFYLHFTDKDDIVWQVTETLIAQSNQLFKAQFAHLSPRDREFELLKLFFEISKYNKKNMLTVLGRDSSPILSARYKEAVVANNAENLREIPDMDSALDVPIEFAANFFTGAVLGLATWWLENDIDYSPQQMAEFYFQLLANWSKVESMQPSGS